MPAPRSTCPCTGPVGGGSPWPDPGLPTMLLTTRGPSDRQAQDGPGVLCSGRTQSGRGQREFAWRRQPAGRAICVRDPYVTIQVGSTSASYRARPATAARGRPSDAAAAVHLARARDLPPTNRHSLTYLCSSHCAALPGDHRPPAFSGYLPKSPEIRGSGLGACPTPTRRASAPRWNLAARAGEPVTRPLQAAAPRPPGCSPRSE
jgi:hypothetical protein